MRELVYLSKRKLSAFDLGRRGLLTKIKATVKAPLGLGELAVETEAGGRAHPDLDTVLTKLDRDPNRAPVWFTEEVVNGQWVQFEAPLAYSVVGTTAVFLDTGEATAVYPSGGSRRLVLHGAAEQLVGVGPRPRTSVEELSAEAAGHSLVPAEAFESVFNHFFDLIDYATGHDVTSRTDPQMIMLRDKITASGLGNVMPTLGRHLRLPDSATWMAGCARVTHVAPPVRDHPVETLFASPLYVEYVAPPRVSG
jgi:hypothetical protein